MDTLNLPGTGSSVAATVCCEEMEGLELWFRTQS
jgi:hypothetical protein